MLREVKSGRAAGNSNRRWFMDDYFELIVWFDGNEAVEGFQLCYDRGRRERAVTWTRAEGVGHVVVDPGEGSPLKNQTPLLRACGAFDREAILGRFEHASALVPPAIVEFVEQELREAAETKS